MRYSEEEKQRREKNEEARRECGNSVLRFDLKLKPASLAIAELLSLQREVIRFEKRDLGALAIADTFSLQREATRIEKLDLASLAIAKSFSLQREANRMKNAFFLSLAIAQEIQLEREANRMGTFKNLEKIPLLKSFLTLLTLFTPQSNYELHFSDFSHTFLSTRHNMMVTFKLT